ncbi:MAG: FAD-dependent oxidoreductase, partial [Candidatus Paceibacteria bacterium]
MYDLIIIGGGPAGTAAGVYASRKRLKTVLITDEFGGQSKVSEDIQNWIGTVSISGNDLAENMKKHLQA